MPMLSSPQFLPPVPAPGGQTPWFQTLVAAISRSIQDDEGSVAVDIIDREQETMSSEDEKALIEALNRWKEDGLRMPEVFDTLSKDLGGDVHGSASRDWRYVSDGSGPLAASARQRSRHVTKNNGTKTTSNSTRVLSRAREHPCPVTREDLRAMALYLFEKGDDRAGPDTLRRRNFALWREFAARPENRKRTLDAWTSIPRLRPKHAAEIERYLKVFQKDADAAKSGMAAELESSLGKHVPRGGTRTALESAADPVHVTGG
ncbi:hypothetical protein GSI_14308 [Ganoderma sinense ZZ0214-1]|uniref:Uncharacterized protein n=1 Tax=Ganoderma sinense ZZ0214-1 TaxID=1077348 RepID=A0A2G8RNC0_9APHY|nr:hypothetical protein GSI_14308 [Ganoderma sinense ZZ0214-1]